MTTIESTHRLMYSLACQANKYRYKLHMHSDMSYHTDNFFGLLTPAEYDPMFISEYILHQ